MEYMGLEPGRIHFSWISSAEATKFVDVAKEVTSAVKALGPRKDFVRSPFIPSEDKVTQHAGIY